MNFTLNKLVCFVSQPAKIQSREVKCNTTFFLFSSQQDHLWDIFLFITGKYLFPSIPFPTLYLLPFEDTSDISYSRELHRLFFLPSLIQYQVRGQCLGLESKLWLSQTNQILFQQSINRITWKAGTMSYSSVLLQSRYKDTANIC